MAAPYSSKHDERRSGPAASGLCEFEVYVDKEDFKFHAAHFMAYDGYRERLHGHNYQVGVRMKGEVKINKESDTF